MAAISQCPSGHFFDRDLYSSCPYCSGEGWKVDRTADNDGGYTMPLSPSPGTVGGISTASGKQ